VPDILDQHGEPAIVPMNGKTGEYLRWVLGFVVAAFVAYFTAMNTINSEIARINATQESQFGEILRRIDVLQDDVRELRGR
jgi:hypothetical protein